LAVLVNFCQLVEKGGAAKTSRDVYALLSLLSTNRIAPSGALRSHAKQLSQGFFLVIIHHRCVTRQASGVYDISLGIEKRDKDRVIMLTTKCFHYNAKTKSGTARAGVN
jgi:hypothetical protein